MSNARGKELNLWEATRKFIVHIAEAAEIERETPMKGGPRKNFLQAEIT